MPTPLMRASLFFQFNPIRSNERVFFSLLFPIFPLIRSPFTLTVSQLLFILFTLFSFYLFGESPLKFLSFEFFSMLCNVLTHFQICSLSFFFFECNFNFDVLFRSFNCIYSLFLSHFVFVNFYLASTL